MHVRLCCVCVLFALHALCFMSRYFACTTLTEVLPLTNFVMHVQTHTAKKKKKPSVNGLFLHAHQTHQKEDEALNRFATQSTHTHQKKCPEL